WRGLPPRTAPCVDGLTATLQLFRRGRGGPRPLRRSRSAARAARSARECRGGRRHHAKRHTAKPAPLPPAERAGSTALLARGGEPARSADSPSLGVSKTVWKSCKVKRRRSR